MSYWRLHAHLHAKLDDAFGRELAVRGHLPKARERLFLGLSRAADGEKHRDNQNYRGEMN